MGKQKFDQWDGADEPMEQPDESKRLKEKEKIALEKQLVAEGKIYPRAHYMPRGRFRGILAVCLALFFGIFLGVAALLGGGLYFGTKTKMKDLFGAFGIDASQYVSEPYLDKNTLELLDDVRKDLAAFGGFDTITLESFAKYTPVIGDAVNSLTSQLKGSLGIELDAEEILKQPFGGAVGYLTEEIKAVELGKVVTALGLDSTAEPGTPNESVADEIPGGSGEGGSEGAPSGGSGMNMHALFRVICYGEPGVDYVADENGEPVLDENGNYQMLGESKPTVIGDLFGEGLSSLLDKITCLKLGDLITIEEGDSKLLNTLGDKKIDEIMKEETINSLRLCDILEIDMESDETSQIMKTLADKTIEDLKQEDTIQSLKIGDLINTQEATGLMAAISDWSIGDLSDSEKIETLKIGDIINAEDATGLMAAISDWSIGDMKSSYKIERLKISDIIEIDENASGIMNAMSDWRIRDLMSQKKIDTLTLSDVIVIGEKETGILKSLQNVPIGKLGDKVGTLTLGEILGKEAFESNKILKHLANSTLDTLSSDLEHLSVGTVFADEVYSFMENGTDGGKPKTYEDLYKAYFGESSDSEYTYNYENPAYNQKATDAHGEPIPDQTLYRPTAVDAATAKTIQTYHYLASGKELSLGYFTRTGKTADDFVFTLYTGEGTPKYNAENNMKNRDNENEDLPVYYCEDPVELEPVFGFGKVDPATGGFFPIEVTVGEDITFTETVEGEEGNETVTYHLLQKANGDWVYGTYTTPEVAEGEEPKEPVFHAAGDIEHYIKSYTVAGTAKSFKVHYLPAAEGSEALDINNYTVGEEGGEIEVIAEKTEDGTAYHYDDRLELFERYYYEEEGAVTSFETTDEAVLEGYRSEDGTKTYSRYLSGVWYLLLCGEDQDGVTVNAEIPVLKLDELVTGISGTMQDTMLAKLWFHGILEENPFVRFSFLNTLQAATPEAERGIQIKHENGDVVLISNLIQVSLGDLVGLMDGINQLVSQYAASFSPKS